MKHLDIQVFLSNISKALIFAAVGRISSYTCVITEVNYLIN